MNSHDMYGNRIYPLGETGYGVSMALAGTGQEQPFWPFFTFFHVSDGFRQSLFSVALDKPDFATLTNVFDNRIRELMASWPHGPFQQLQEIDG